jgi:hypothetical protein
MMMLIGAAGRADCTRRDLEALPQVEVDLTGAKLSPTSTVRGWEAMPAVLA